MQLMNFKLQENQMIKHCDGKIRFRALIHKTEIERSHFQSDYRSVHMYDVQDAGDNEIYSKDQTEIISK